VLTRAEFAAAHFWVAKLRGRFGRTGGTIVLDADGHAGSIDFTVDATSVDTGWSVRDNFIRGADIFDVAHYPTMRFRSTQLIFDRVRLVGAAGELTLHNVTHPIRVRVERLDCGPEPASGHEGCGVAVVASIKRSEFGMSLGLPFIGDDIDLWFHLSAFPPRDAGPRGITRSRSAPRCPVARSHPSPSRCRGRAPATDTRGPRGSRVGSA
jgi:polyisoprenoid-binding protein YceI